MAVTTNLSSLDLRYYSQTIGCAIADLGYLTSREFFYGRKCANDSLRKLQLAIALQKILERYEPIGTTTLATRSITIETGTTGSLGVEILNGSLNVGNVAFNTSLYQTGQDLQTLVNGSPSTYQNVTISDVIALGDPSISTTPTTIVFTAPIGTGTSGNGIKVGLFNLSSDYSFNIEGMSYLQGGTQPIVDYDNCLTEQQMQDDVIPTLEKILQIRLPLPGIITGTSSSIASNDLLSELGDSLLTELGTDIII